MLFSELLAIGFKVEKTNIDAIMLPSNTSRYIKMYNDILNFVRDLYVKGKYETAYDLWLGDGREIMKYATNRYGDSCEINLNSGSSPFKSSDLYVSLRITVRSIILYNQELNIRLYVLMDICDGTVYNIVDIFNYIKMHHADNYDIYSYEDDYNVIPLNADTIIALILQNRLNNAQKIRNFFNGEIKAIKNRYKKELDKSKIGIDNMLEYLEKRKKEIENEGNELKNE